MLIKTALLCAALLTSFTAVTAAPEPTALPERIVLTLNGDPARQVAVTWRTATNTAGTVQVTPDQDGPALDKDARAVQATTPTGIETTTGVTRYYHTATLDNLQPDTRYAYRVGNGDLWSEWDSFRTAGATPGKFTFIYSGDAQTGIHSLWSRVLREAFRKAPHARFILHAGDLINNANNDDQWGEWFDAAGWINRVVPIIATPGNHEYFRVKGQENRQLCQLWVPQFEYPRNGLPHLPDSNYFIDYEGLRIVSLNSNLDHEPQAKWLDETLTNNPNRWTIVTFHHPVHSGAIKRDNAELREVWLPIIDKHRVDLVLQGHDHTYARSEMLSGGKKSDPPTSGSVYVVSVGGSKMYDLTTINRDLMARVAEDTQLYQVITVDADTLTYKAYTATGKKYDEFELH